MHCSGRLSPVKLTNMDTVIRKTWRSKIHLLGYEERTWPNASKNEIIKSLIGPQMLHSPQETQQSMNRAMLLSHRCNSTTILAFRSVMSVKLFFFTSQPQLGSWLNLGPEYLIIYRRIVSYEWTRVYLCQATRLNSSEAPSSSGARTSLK